MYWQLVPQPEAEGWARALKGDVIEAYSAGIETHGMNARAVQVMAEAGVDISGQRSKHVDKLASIGVDYVVTVCDRANESCPFFPRKTEVVHVGLDEPPRLAAGATTEEEALDHDRRVRDEIRTFVEKLPEVLEEPRPSRGASRSFGRYRDNGTLAQQHLRLAAIILLEPELEGNYERVKADTFPWESLK